MEKRVCETHEGKLIFCTIDEAIKNDYPKIYNGKNSLDLIQQNKLK